MRLIGALGLLVFLCSTNAHAQITAADKAAAETLFERGRELNRDHKYAEACARFEQSQAIESSLGTMLYLADCYEKLGRTASAWALFLDAASQAAAAGQTERAQTGKHRAELLEPSLSKLRLLVAPEGDVAGLELVRNGSQVARGLWGMSLPIDPGEYVIEARAPDRISWNTRVRVDPGGASVSVAVPALQQVPALAQAPVTPQPTSVAQQEAMPPTAAQPPVAQSGDAARPSPILKIVGAAAAGLGAVGLVVGSVYGVRAISKNNGAKRTCDQEGGTVCRTDEGLQLTHQADSAADVANVLIIGGSTLLIAGAITFLLAPRSERPSVGFVLEPGRAGVQVAGRF